MTMQTLPQSSTQGGIPLRQPCRTTLRRQRMPSPARSPRPTQVSLCSTIPRSTWFIWKSGRWASDDRAYVFHAARVFCRAVRAKLTDPPSSLAKIAFAAAVDRAARADPKMAVSHEIWDTDPWLLGTPGGVVDLRTGILKAAMPDLYIARHTTVVPAPPGTPAPLWQDFLNDATRKDEELQQFLRRLAGYMLTGDVTEEVLTFLYGPGGNGKGVFLGALTGILGEYHGLGADRGIHRGQQDQPRILPRANGRSSGCHRERDRSAGDMG